MIECLFGGQATSKSYDIDFWPCTKTEGEHYCANAITYIKYLLTLNISPRPFVVNVCDG